MILQTTASVLITLLTTDCRLTAIQQTAKRIDERNTVQQILIAEDYPPTSQISNDRTTLLNNTIN